MEIWNCLKNLKYLNIYIPILLVSSVETNSCYFGKTFNIKLKGKITRTNDSFPAFQKLLDARITRLRWKRPKERGRVKKRSFVSTRLDGSRLDVRSTVCARVSSSSSSYLRALYLKAMHWAARTYSSDMECGPVAERAHAARRAILPVFYCPVMH